MPSILLPEEEVVVTPGPEAVRDLESLPNPALPRPRGAIRIGNVRVKDAEENVREEYSAVDVVDKAVMNAHQPWKFGLYDAITTIEAWGQEVPSAPLLCELLHRMLCSRLDEKVKSVLDQFDGINGPYAPLRIGERVGIHCNTRVNWSKAVIEHYPRMSDPFLPALVNPDELTFVNRGRTYPLSFQDFPKHSQDADDIRNPEERYFLEQLLGKNSLNILGSLGDSMGIPVRVLGPSYNLDNPTFVQISFGQSVIRVDYITDPGSHLAKGITRGVRTYA